MQKNTGKSSNPLSVCYIKDITIMKTIAQIAQELGVTKPAVRKYLTDEIREQFSETVGGVIHISEQGEELIKSKFHKNTPETVTENISGNEPETVSVVSAQVSTLIAMLQKELEEKNKQLESKDHQIEELTATIKIQAESINAANKNELAETIIEGQASMPKLEPEKKKGVFQRLFSRNKE
jgi:predicted transcriptional regulator